MNTIKCVRQVTGKQPQRASYFKKMVIFKTCICVMNPVATDILSNPNQSIITLTSWEGVYPWQETQMCVCQGYNHHTWLEP